MMVPVVQIVTPADATANNGNWRTAHRWAQFLRAGQGRDTYRVILQGPDAVPDPAAELLIALHATRSHDFILRWRRDNPGRPVILILTGTDLYHDLPDQPATRLALDLADMLVVLQSHALLDLPEALRGKARTIYQSAVAMPRRRKATRRLDCTFVGHLRDEKDPAAVVRAWRFLPINLPITLTLIGRSLDPVLARKVGRAASGDRRIRWAGERPHERTLDAIQHAHLLINASRMEGGAHVIAEAVAAGTPVLASRMAGNLGMLGGRYRGYFPVGNARLLAGLLRCCLTQPHFLRILQLQCLRRRALFAPALERQAVLSLVASTLQGHKMGPSSRIAPEAPATTPE